MISEMASLISKNNVSLKDLKQCEEEKRKAYELGNEALVRLWSQAEMALHSFNDTLSFSGKLHDIKAIPLPPSPKIIAEGMQLSTESFMKSTQAFAENNFLKAMSLVAISESLKKASQLYYDTALSVHQEILERYSFNQEEQEKAVFKYRSYQAQALEKKKESLAQQWAEAACLAQESVIKIKKAKLIFSHAGDSPLYYSWMIANSWTYRASLARAAVAEAMNETPQEKRDQLHAIAASAEQASSYRSQAARALQKTSPLLTHYWTLAAYWSGNASLYLQQHLNEPLFSWNTKAQEALAVASAYAKAAMSCTRWYHPLFYQHYLAKKASCRESDLRSQVATLIASLETVR